MEVEKITENAILAENNAKNCTESMVESKNCETNNQNISSERLLGELLRFARSTGEMKFLMLLREVKSLEIINKEVTIFADDQTILELESEKYKSLITGFLSKKGLILNLKKQDSKEADIKELERLCGGKLKIK